MFAKQCPKDESHERLNGEKVMGGRGGGGWQLFPTEFGKLCVPLKKSWLRPC